MGNRSWAKDRQRGLMRRARTDEQYERDLRMMSLDTPLPEDRSKADLRAEIEAMTANCRVRRLPTRVDLKCGKCGHTGRAFLRDNQRGKPFKCSRCGNSQRLP